MSNRNELITKLEKKLNNPDDILLLRRLLDNIDYLSNERKKELSKYIIKELQKLYDAQLIDNDSELCKKEGHIYSKWNCYGTVYHNARSNNNEWTSRIWSRKCIRCGKLESTNTEPKELVKERTKNEKR